MKKVVELLSCWVVESLGFSVAQQLNNPTTQQRNVGFSAAPTTEQPNNPTTQQP